MHGDLCKHLEIDLSTDHPDWYSNLFLNAYINRHVHAECLKWSNSIVLLAYGMFFYIVLTPISTTSGLWSTDKIRKYQQIDVYIYQCECSCDFGIYPIVEQRMLSLVEIDLFNPFKPCVFFVGHGQSKQTQIMSDQDLHCFHTESSLKN